MMIDKAGVEGPIVQLSIEFRAPRAKIFQSWTEPEILKKWFFADVGFRCTTAEVDLRPLGAYALAMTPPSGGPELVARGHYLEIERGARLVYSWAAMSEPPYWTMVTAKFGDAGGGSRVELTHGIFESDKDRLAHEQGWLGCLTQLGKLLGE